MRDHISKLLGRNYENLNTIEISSASLIHNYKHLSSKHLAVAPVLKSNAYGHGLIQVAQTLDPLAPPFFCVDSLYEAYELQKAKIKTPILIMGYVNPKSLKTKKLPFSFAVYSEEIIRTLARYQPHASVHIFLDTGMHREGILISELPTFLAKLSQTSLTIDGVMSHFAMSDNPHDSKTKSQIECWKNAHTILVQQGISPRYRHFANSSGILNKTSYKDLGNVARAGIALYGIDPEGKDTHLKPALTLKTHIAQIKTIEKGESVGYDFTHTAEKQTKIAILPIGYHDGVDRGLSNKGFVKIGKTFSPIIGRISMNITTIDVTEVKPAKVGTEVIVYSDKTADMNSIQNAAKLCEKIPYELLVNLIPTTKRVVR